MERLYKVVETATATKALVMKTTQPLLSRSFLVGESGKKRGQCDSGWMLQRTGSGSTQGDAEPQGWGTGR